MKAREQLDYLMSNKGPEPESPDDDYTQFGNKRFEQMTYQDHLDKSLSDRILKDKTNNYQEDNSFHTQSSIARKMDQSSTPSDKAFEEILENKPRKKTKKLRASGQLIANSDDQGEAAPRTESAYEQILKSKFRHKK